MLGSRRLLRLRRYVAARRLLSSRVVATVDEIKASKFGSVKFSLNDDWEGFVFLRDEQVYGYENACAHMALELDFDDADFFTMDGNFIQCKVHGALFSPENGLCARGPCKNKSLRALPLERRGDEIYLLNEPAAENEEEADASVTTWDEKASLSPKAQARLDEKKEKSRLKQEEEEEDPFQAVLAAKKKKEDTVTSVEEPIGEKEAGGVITDPFEAALAAKREKANKA